VDNKNKALHDICVLWGKTKSGFHNHGQRNGLGFHNFSLVKSRFVKCANNNLCISRRKKSLIRASKPLTLIIFVKSIYVTLAVLVAGEDMFENNTYNTAAQNLNEIEATPPDDYSLIPATNWDNLPLGHHLCER
jgi:hypothetical protein